MAVKVSIIIPNRNAEATIGECLKAAFASNYKDFEVIVVDDFSSDNSLELIKQFPCKCIQLTNHSGVFYTSSSSAIMGEFRRINIMTRSPVIVLISVCKLTNFSPVMS